MLEKGFREDSGYFYSNSFASVHTMKKVLSPISEHKMVKNDLKNATPKSLCNPTGLGVTILIV